MAPAYSLAATYGLMVAAAGPGAPLALVALTVPVIFVAIAFHRMCEEHPVAGSTYSWARLVFGDRVGAFSGWIVMLSYFVAAVAAAVPAGVYSLNLLHLYAAANDPLAVAATGGLWIVAAGLLLAWGMRPTADATAIFLLLEFAALLALAGMAIAHPAVSAAPPAPLLTIGNAGTYGFFGAMVIAIWVTDGWEISTYASEENTGSRRQPGSSALVALCITVFVMLVCAIAYARVAPIAGIVEHQTDTLAYVADQLGGGWRTWTMVLAVLASTGTTLWTGQLGLSRVMFSASRDGLLPRAFTRVHPRFGTPAVAVAVVTAGALALSLLTGLLPSVNAMLNDAVSVTSVLLGLTFITTGACCVVHFARKRVPLTDPTRIVLPALGTLAVFVLLIINFRSQTVVDQWASVGCVIVGAVYALAGHRLVTGSKTV